MQLLTIKQTAEILNVTVPRAYELARRGILPVVRLGRQLRIEPAALNRLIEAGGVPVDHENATH